MAAPQRRKEDTDPIESAWARLKPYWHIFSFLAAIVFLVSTKWAKVTAYDERLVALEVWRIEVSKDMATMGQEIHDIHEQVVPKRR